MRVLCPPQAVRPVWLWSLLVEGRDLRRHSDLLEGMKTSADLSYAPPVISIPGGWIIISCCKYFYTSGW